MKIQALRQTASLPALLLTLAESVPVYAVIVVVLVSGPYPFLLVALAMLAPRLLIPLLFDDPPISRQRRWVLYALIIGCWLIIVRVSAFPAATLFDLAWLPDALQGLALVEGGARRVIWASALLTGYAWWRALQRNELSVGVAYGLLRGGTLALVAVAFILVPLSRVERAALDESELVLAALAFYASVLLGLSVLRGMIASKQSRQGALGAWLASAAGPVVGIVLIATLAAGLLSGQVRDTLTIPFEPGFQFISFLLESLIQLVTLLFMLILRPIFWVLEWIFSLLEGSQENPPPTPPSVPPEPSVEASLSLPSPVGYAFAALAIIGGLWLLARLIGQIRPRPASSLNEERSSVFIWQDALDGLGGRRARPRSAASDPLAHLRGQPEWDATLRIRDAYAAFQRWGASKGRRRAHGETAGQYGDVIHHGLAAYPESQRGVDALTALYRKARYSGVPATSEEAEIAGSATDRIERAGE